MKKYRKKKTTFLIYKLKEKYINIFYIIAKYYKFENLS